ncbi:bacterial transferase hexapeptide repeat protein [Neocallimastix sp. 'constans']|jgi:acetyltransferase-like isoleucine patch superfamily enzyme
MPKVLELNEFLEFLNKGEVVKFGSDVHHSFHHYSVEAHKLTHELNSKYHSRDEAREIFSNIIGKKLDETFGIFPPFQTEFGKNIHVGKHVFINSGCTFQDHGGIYIEDNVLIGHNVVLATLNHVEDPEHRTDSIPKPIHIKKGVWIGSNSTILQGVTIGENSIVAAGAVVTHDVPPNCIVGGVPAKFIRKIKTSNLRMESSKL